ncbi:vacuolar protein sorting-associated protein 36 [Trametopsis cervina]|nr:vacuolar protein sorting-associated protein 36 [Trametopsis cervina]
MNTLRRYTRQVDGTIPVPALLYNDEEILASQEGVGIYDGNQKSPQHQSGTVYATTHRLFYVDNVHSSSRSFALALNHIGRTDYYAGLLRSSAKITLYLNAISSTAARADSLDRIGQRNPAEEIGSWECEVCSYRNPPGLSPAASKVCGLCGVPRSAITNDSPSTAVPRQLQKLTLSSSLPSSSSNLHAHAASAPPSRSEPNASSEVACPACTFLNHPLLSNCEICGTALPKPPPRHGSAKSAPSSRPPSDDEDTDEGADGDGNPRMMKISFRKGGDKAFYAVLRRSLLGKAWEASAQNSTDAATSGKSRSGISAILHEVNTKATTSQSNLEDALQDLEALMVKAREMVRVAEDLNERLSASNAAAESATPNASAAPDVVEPEEATFIRSSLAQLGLQMENAPVTQDMIKDERRWHAELARELAGVLQGRGDRDAGGMMKKRGIVALDEIWGGWNRARGVSLIPPATFLQVLPHLPVYTAPPIHVRTFTSGLSVLHTPPYTRTAFSSRIVSLLALVGPRTTIELAYEEQLPIGLTQDMILEVEETGDVCRDDGGAGVNMLDDRQGGETQWWTNIFRDYTWDGQPDDG